MRIRLHVLLAALSVSVLSSIVGPGVTASAHTYTDWMARTWPSTDRTAEWRFTTNVPTGTNFRNRVKDAAFTWNSEGQSMTFAHQQGDASPSATWCAAGANSLVDYSDISDGYHALHSGCGATVSGGSNLHMNSFKITFDSYNSYLNQNYPGGWWTDTYPPGTQTLRETTRDAQGVATHEFGHATGRCCFTATGQSAPSGGDTSGHFIGGSGHCPWDYSRHTMCDGATTTSTFDSRSLETHDKDVFNNAY